MLNINPDIVCAIIEKCQEFHAKEDVSIPHEHEWDGDNDWAMQTLADHADDATLSELRYIIQELDVNHQIELLCLLWLGQGDYEKEEWHDALREAQGQWHSRSMENLIATPLVADYLQEGLWSLGYDCGE